MDEQRGVTSNSDEVAVGEGFVGCVSRGRRVAQTGTTAGHMIQGMLLLLLLLVDTLLMLTGVVVIVMRLVGLMIILRVGATAQTRGVILTLAAAETVGRIEPSLP